MKSAICGVRQILLGLGTAVLLAGVRAEVLFSDDFEGVGEIENVPLIESKVTWEAAENRNLLSVATDPAGLKSGRVLAIGNGLVFARLPLKALEPGEALMLSLRFRSPDENVKYPAPLRVGICESRDEVPEKGETVGYWFNSGPGHERKSAIGLERNVDSLIGGGNDSTGVGAVFPLDYDWQAPHQLKLKIVRASATGMEISTQLDDADEVVRIDEESAITQFNLVALRMANIPQSRLLIDQIKLEVLKASAR